MSATTPYGMACIYITALSYQTITSFRSFGIILTPVHYRRRIARPVSYYALFKWWLLLSQHPGCRGNSTSLVTKYNLGTLAGDLGCFPLVPGAYPPRTISRDNYYGIRSLVQ